MSAWVNVTDGQTLSLFLRVVFCIGKKLRAPWRTVRKKGRQNSLPVEGFLRMVPLMYGIGEATQKRVRWPSMKLSCLFITINVLSLHTCRLYDAQKILATLEAWSWKYRSPQTSFQQQTRWNPCCTAISTSSWASTYRHISSTHSFNQTKGSPTDQHLLTTPQDFQWLWFLCWSWDDKKENSMARKVPVWTCNIAVNFMLSIIIIISWVYVWP